MGVHFLDQYSLLHASSGVIAYFFGIPLWLWIMVHLLFEWAENTVTGMRWINHYLTFWPGGKPAKDAFINNLGDTASAIVGWLVASALDRYATMHHWYPVTA